MSEAKTYGFTVTRDDPERDYGTDEMAEIALEKLGYRNTGSGTNLITGERDLDFESDVPLTEDAITAIKAALLEETGIEFTVGIWLG